jgi:hypothetical protein
MWQRREGELITVGKEIGLEEIEGYLGLDALLKLKKRLLLRQAPRDDGLSEKKFLTTAIVLAE